MLEIKQFIFGPFGTNTYVLNDEQGHVLLVDPACYDEYERQQLLGYIHQIPNFKSSISILATHGHLDHLWGAKWATETWQTPVWMHEADIPMVNAMQQQYELFGVRRTAESFPVQEISGLKSPISNLQSQISILHTPGHTPGSICLYFPLSPANPLTHSSTHPILLSGDTLFRMGYGRTDLPGGNMSQLISSLEHLFTLPPDTIVYPGHGDSTTIASETR